MSLIRKAAVGTAVVIGGHVVYNTAIAGHYMFEYFKQAIHYYNEHGTIETDADYEIIEMLTRCKISPEKGLEKYEELKKKGVL